MEGVPQPPSLTPKQRQAALDKAAKVRRERAKVKEMLKMGSITLSELLQRSEKDETVGKMKVLSVLESLPGLGKVKARRLMETAGISESRRLQGLGANQRDALLQSSGHHAYSESLLNAVERIGAKIRPDLTDDELHAAAQSVASSVRTDGARIDVDEVRRLRASTQRAIAVTRQRAPARRP